MWLVLPSTPPPQHLYFSSPFPFLSSSSCQGRWARGTDDRRHSLLGKTKPKGWNGTVLNVLARLMRADRWVRCTSQQYGLVGLALDAKCIWHNACTWSALSSIPTPKQHAFRIACQIWNSLCLFAGKCSEFEGTVIQLTNYGSWFFSL